MQVRSPAVRVRVPYSSSLAAPQDVPSSWKKHTRPHRFRSLMRAQHTDSVTRSVHNTKHATVYITSAHTSHRFSRARVQYTKAHHFSHACIHDTTAVFTSACHEQNQTIPKVATSVPASSTLTMVLFYFRRLPFASRLPFMIFIKECCPPRQNSRAECLKANVNPLST